MNPEVIKKATATKERIELVDVKKYKQYMQTNLVIVNNNCIQDLTQEAHESGKIVTCVDVL